MKSSRALRASASLIVCAGLVELVVTVAGRKVLLLGAVLQTSAFVLGMGW